MTCQKMLPIHVTLKAGVMQPNLLKGGNPQRRMYVITPAAQISTFKPYLKTMTRKQINLPKVRTAEK